jgi:hypothetical protein
MQTTAQPQADRLERLSGSSRFPARIKNLEFVLALNRMLTSFTSVLGGTARALCHSAGARAFFHDSPRGH